MWLKLYTIQVCYTAYENTLGCAEYKLTLDPVSLSDLEDDDSELYRSVLDSGEWHKQHAFKGTEHHRVSDNLGCD